MSRTLDNGIRLVLVLVFAYLVLVHWRGATAVLRQGGASTAGVIKTLQGR